MAVVRICNNVWRNLWKVCWFGWFFCDVKNVGYTKCGLAFGLIAVVNEEWNSVSKQVINLSTKYVKFHEAFVNTLLILNMATV